GPGRALAAAEALILSISTRRSLACGILVTGTRRTISCPRRVRMTSSPASARFTSSVNWPFASLTDTRILPTPALKLPTALHKDGPSLGPSQWRDHEP